MNDSALMGMLQRLCYPNAELSYLSRIGSVLHHPVGEGNTSNEIADDKDCLPVTTNLMDRGNMRMTQLRRSTRFAEEKVNIVGQ